MEIIPLELPWTLLIKSNIFEDNRWKFIKIFNEEYFKINWLDTNFKELYYSISNKNVIRWMHFQIPDKDHTKLVYVTSWNIKDVLIDIRKNSPTYWKSISIDINWNDWIIIYIPKWIAHWFLSKNDNTIVNYLQSSWYSKEHDFWIKYNSFGFDWWKENHIISDRDISFINFDDFSTPFIYWINC